mgnify:CR=1 FL=1|jgi:hypothetical protein
MPMYLLYERAIQNVPKFQKFLTVETDPSRERGWGWEDDYTGQVGVFKSS